MEVKQEIVEIINRQKIAKFQVQISQPVKTL